MPAVKALAVLLMTVLFMSAAHSRCMQQSLRIAVIPKTKQSADDLVREYKPLLKLLGGRLQVPVEIVPAPSYESVIDAVVSGGVDVAWLGPAAYVIAHQRDSRIEPFASLTITPGYFTPAGHHYQALLLARKGTAQSIDALKNASVVLTDPASTSGSVMPNVEFSRQVKQPLGSFFSSVAYSGSHEKSLDALLDHKVDAAFVASVRADAYLSEGRIARDTFTVLWRSSPIFYDPFVFRGSLCQDMKKDIRAAMFGDSPELRAFLKSQSASGIARTVDADYLPLARVMGEDSAGR